MRHLTWPTDSRVLLAAAVLLGALGLVTAQPAPVPEDGYASGNYGRVRYQENGATIVRADPEAADLERADPNVPLFPGDTLVTGIDQRAEVQLASGTVIRLDRDSELTFLALPNPYAEISDHAVLQLVRGTLRLTARLRENEEFRIDTPSATIYAVDDASVRIETSANGSTRVASRRGVVEVVAAGGSVLVRGGMVTDVVPGDTPYAAEPFNTFLSDDFDRWVEDRDSAYRIRDRYASADDREVYEQLPEEVQPYYTELSTHGEWEETDDYGHVWYPEDVADDWRPYYDGYWGYGPSGYFWIASEPWGWAPYHYGRWVWGHRGWGWVPGRVFGGAWVSWSWGPSYVGWCALGFWNYPVFHSVAHFGYYSPYSWTFVGYNNLHHYGRHGQGRHAVPYDDVHDSLPRHAVVTGAPTVPPRQLADSRQTREATVREMHEIATGRVARIDGDRSRTRSFADQERTSTRRNSRTRVPDTELPESRRARQLPVETGGARIPAAGRGRVPAVTSKPGAGATRSEPVRRLQSGSDGAADRMRDLYRQVTGPRTTREMKDGGSSREATGQRDGSERQPSESQPTQRKAGEREPSERKQPDAKTDRDDAQNRGRRPVQRQGKQRPPRRDESRETASGQPVKYSTGLVYSPPKAGGRERTRSSDSGVRRRTATQRSSAAPATTSAPRRPSASSGRSGTPRRPSALSVRTSSPRRPSASSGRSSTSRRPSASSRRTSSPRRPSASSARSSTSRRPSASSGGRPSGSRPSASRGSGGRGSSSRSSAGRSSGSRRSSRRGGRR